MYVKTKKCRYANNDYTAKVEQALWCYMRACMQSLPSKQPSKK